MEKEFWDNRWETEQLGWDMGQVSPPLKAYFDQLSNKALKILIPGCGNAYEAQYLHEQGFENVFVIDISKLALQSFEKRYPEFPKDHLIHGDFFKHKGEYDLIVEQTFFCAIHPSMRDQYVRKMSELLKKNGMLIGLLFDFPLEDGPPFGGNKKEYQERFKKHFDQIKIERCYNSIPPRQGRELWVELAS